MAEQFESNKQKPDHIVVVMEENHAFEDIIGNSDAPFMNSLAKGGRSFTDAFAVAHPSQPNYIALFSGSTQGVTDDGKHNLPAVPNLATQLGDAGLSFTGFVESGSPRRHNPWESFANTKNVEKNMDNFPTDFNQLPAVSFVVPNLENDMHDGTVAQADQWLQDKLGAYANWATTHNSQLIVLTDEDDHLNGNHIPVIEFGDGIKPAENNQTINTIAILHGIENELGLPFLGDQADAAQFGKD
jgi:acid phosphatase